MLLKTHKSVLTKSLLIAFGVALSTASMAATTATVPSCKTELQSYCPSKITIVSDVNHCSFISIGVNATGECSSIISANVPVDGKDYVGQNVLDCKWKPGNLGDESCKLQPRTQTR